MRKEWLLSIAVAATTIVVALAGIRYFAPQLLGIPIDLQAVRVSEKVPPFFENVFRPSDFRSDAMLIKDPYVRIRGKPLQPRLLEIGPHDLLGFRNHSVPNVADIVVIGDSQTYGNNSLLENNWPHRMAAALDQNLVVYSMATGGWGAVQYLDMVQKSSAFRPRVIVVAFYAGNDPIETFSLVYQSATDRWAELKVNSNTSPGDHPEFVGVPSPPEKNWTVQFKDGTSIVFTPSLRLVSNDTSYGVVREGWAIMLNIVKRMGSIAHAMGTSLVVTMIPTKELVYLERIRKEGIPLDAVYEKLVTMEQHNIDEFFREISAVSTIHPVDVLAQLRAATLAGLPPYPASGNGHPNDVGYQVIGSAIAAGVEQFLSEPKRRLRNIVIPDRKLEAYFLIKKNELFLFSSGRVAADNGWKLSEAEPLSLRTFSKPITEVISKVDRARYGPLNE